ncbi:MAG TPA: hypothetical protein VES64_09875, partial [Allosphingosinicella sp.]|nr:hypothetical protein [Allosphingosinicella sp.]
TGIALSGWDRLGWAGGFAERWMRARDRQSVLAALVLCAAYFALILWALLLAVEALTAWAMRPLPPFLTLLIAINSALLVWRLAMRFGFVARFYNLGEGLRSVPRMVTGNMIAMMAARRAVIGYLGGRGPGTPVWDKTDHVFPRQLPAE